MTDTRAMSQQRAILAHAAALLALNEPSRIVIQAHACDDAGLFTGQPVVITFEPPGVLRVFDKVTARLLAQSVPGQLTTPAAAVPF